MGYQAPIDLTDPHGRRYHGRVRPASAGLRKLLAAALEDDWLDALPAELPPVGLLSATATRIRIEDENIDVVVKRIPPDRPRWYELLATPWQRSRAHRAYAWSHRLRAHGIVTPRPLAYIERRSASRLAPSVVISEHVAAPTLEELRDRDLSNTDKRVLIDRVASLLAKMHNLRLLHADFHVGNLLVHDDELYVLDLESMRPYGRSARVAMKNLVRLNRDFLDTSMVSRSDRMRFLDRYLRHAADRRRRRRALFDKVRLKTEAKLVERGERFVPGLKLDAGI